METSDVAQLIIIIVLIFLSGFFSSAETAFSTLNRVRMRNLEEEGSKKPQGSIRFWRATVKCFLPS